MRRPAIMSLTFVLAVSVAPGLLRAAEGGKLPTAEQQPAEASGPDGKGTPQDHTGTQQRGATGWTGGAGKRDKASVGSRALTGPEAQKQAAGQPEMATGVDLKGPPV